MAKSFHDAFIDELRDAYDAEKQLVTALPKLAKAAASRELQAAFERHLGETREHVSRLEDVFTSLGEPIKGRRCEGIAGIIEDGDGLLDEDFDEDTLDAVLIASGQRAEHYEMAAYGSLIAWARTMGHGDAAALLAQTLAEEKAADRTLTDLAEDGINDSAAAAVQGDASDIEDESRPGTTGARRAGASAHRMSRKLE